jgi:hypothetical protein
MKPLSRKKRLVENEVIFRSVNKNIQQFVEGENGHNDREVIEFYCECSHPNCLERIKLTIKEYKELHGLKSHFVILIGHEFPEVEKVIEKRKGYELVEKYIMPPSDKDINLALNTIIESLPSA